MNFGKVLLWIAILIGLYLLLKDPWGTNTLIGTMASNSLKGIAVLQGKDVKGVTA